MFSGFFKREKNQQPEVRAETDTEKEERRWEEAKKSKKYREELEKESAKRKAA